MFSVAICNPPYSGNLHLRILEKVIPVAEEVVNISPIRWLQDPLAKYKKNSDLNKFEDSIAKHIVDVKQISTDDSIGMFDAAFNMQLGIQKYDSDTHNFILNENKLLDKIISNIPDDKIEYVNTIPEKYSVVISLISGGNGGRTENTKHWLGPKDKSFYIDGKNSNGETYYEYRKRVCWGNNKPHAEVTHVEFDTKQEMINFYDACETTFFRYVFKKELVDVNVNYKFLPIMSDYSKPWTNERFCEYFGIADEEWKEILTTMEKYK